MKIKFDFMDIQFFILIATIIAAIFIYVNAKKDNSTKEEILTGTKTLQTNAEKTISDLSQVNNEVIESHKKLIKTYDKVIENLNKTIETKETVISTQHEIIGQLTGGNSYPRIGVGDKSFFVIAEGTYSIPECNIEIVLIRNYIDTPIDATYNYLEKKELDNTNFISVCNTSFPKLWINSKTIQIPYKDIIYESIKNDDSFGFDIYYNSPFKRWLQHIRFLRFPDNKEKFGIVDILTEEKSYSKKRDYSKITTIFREVSNEFPTVIFEEKTNKKFYLIDLYYNDNQKLMMYNYNFALEITKENETLPVYTLNDFASATD